MRVVVAGSRNQLSLGQPVFIENWLNDLSNYLFHIDELVSGGCKTGVDAYAEDWASRNGIKVKVFSADWNLGNKAGPIRNRQMAKYADALIAFPLSTAISKGTRDMIEAMAALKKPHIVLYLPER